jgi:flagellar hook assembly protein FlgD
VDAFTGSPAVFSLSQNYPNPFNPATAISYSIQSRGVVILKVYDVLGREVKTLMNERQNAGIHTVNLDGRDLPSGVYFYRIVAGGYTSVRKMLLLK